MSFTIDAQPAKKRASHLGVTSSLAVAARPCAAKLPRPFVGR